MGKSKETFMEVRQAQELALQPITKQDIERHAQNICNDVDQGNMYPEEALYKAKLFLIFAEKIKAHVDDMVRNKITSDKEVRYNGAEFTLRSGYVIYDYEKDPLYAELNSKLKQRENALKEAMKAREKGKEVVHGDGEVMPSIPIKSTVKDSIIIKL